MKFKTVLQFIRVRKIIWLLVIVACVYILGSLCAKAGHDFWYVQPTQMSPLSVLDKYTKALHPHQWLKEKSLLLEKQLSALRAKQKTAAANFLNLSKERLPIKDSNSELKSSSTLVAQTKQSADIHLQPQIIKIIIVKQTNEVSALPSVTTKELAEVKILTQKTNKSGTQATTKTQTVLMPNVVTVDKNKLASNEAKVSSADIKAVPIIHINLIYPGYDKKEVAPPIATTSQASVNEGVGLKPKALPAMVVENKKNTPEVAQKQQAKPVEVAPKPTVAHPVSATTPVIKDNRSFTAASKEELRKLLIDLEKNTAIKQLQKTDEQKTSTASAMAPTANDKQKQDDANNVVIVKQEKNTYTNQRRVYKTSTSAEPVIIISNTKSIIEDR